MDGLVPSFWAKLPNQSKVNHLACSVSNFCAKLPKLSKWTHWPNISAEIGTPASSISDPFKLNISTQRGLPRLASEPAGAAKG